MFFLILEMWYYIYTFHLSRLLLSAISVFLYIAFFRQLNISMVNHKNNVYFFDITRFYFLSHLRESVITIWFYFFSLNQKVDGSVIKMRKHLYAFKVKVEGSNVQAAANASLQPLMDLLLDGKSKGILFWWR